MLTNEQIKEANIYGEWLRQVVHNCELPANNRVRAAGSCLTIAQDHHHAIVFLLEGRLYASSFALLRVEFEAYIRGEWLALCATDDEVKQFLKGYEKPKDRPNIDCMIQKLESTPAFEEQKLSCLKQRTWKALCSYTHTDGLHVQRWNTAEAIEPNYSDDDLVEVLQFADIIVSLSVLGIIKLMKDKARAEAIAQNVLDRFKKRIEK
jgi:hypothetical protein